MSYNADSIELRDFRTACRKTPGMYIGADGQNGIFNCFLEILNNACDEAIMGRGNKVEVKLSKDLTTCIIIDHGAGIPHGPNKDTNEVLIELFTTAHSSGKFDTKNYKKVRGLHGVGSSAVCVCSKKFNVITKRDGFAWSLNFVDGLPQSETATKGAATAETGTEISFSPDRDIFHVAADLPSFDKDKILNELELTSYFIPNVKFELTYDGKKQSFLSKNGLRDFAASRIKSPLHKNYIYGYKEFDDEVEVEVFAQWTAGKEQCYVFSNGAMNIDGGTPITGAKTAFTRTVNSLGGTNFDGDLIRRGLVYIINVRHPAPIYQNQSKTKIQNAELKGYTQTVLTEAIKDFAFKHANEFNSILEVLKKETKAEAAAERARQNVLNASKEIEKNQKKKVFASDKLKDAEFLGNNSILLLCEGLSASASIINARDEKKYGVLALRGKPINVFTHTEDKILENEEIKLLLSAMNIVPGKYNGNKLRYGKIGICSDADADGFHIGLLISCILQYFAPQFIQEGRLCWLRSPLYIVKSGKKEYYYYNDDEYNKRNVKGETTRCKGLGSLSVEQAHNSMFTDEFQRLDTLVPSEGATELLYNLMGDDVPFRQKYIFDNIDFSEIKE